MILFYFLFFQFFDWISLSKQNTYSPRLDAVFWGVTSGAMLFAGHINKIHYMG